MHPRMRASSSVGVLEPPSLVACACGHEVFERLTKTVTTEDDEVLWCSKCTDRSAFYCGDCGTLYSNRDHESHSTAENGDVCGPCFEEYSVCDRCNEAYVHGRICDDYSWRCDSCASDYEDEISADDEDDEDDDDTCSNGLDGNYRKNPASLFGFLGETSDRLYMGVELETECDRGTRQKCYNHIDAAIGHFTIMKEDGSLHNGLEIVSAPATLEHHRSAWDKLLLKLPSGLSSWSSGRCGIHIHVSRSALTALDIGKLCKFVNFKGNRQLIESVAGRYNAEYCNVTDLERSYDSGAPTTLSIEEMARRCSSKYNALNTSPSETIEFRLFRGTLNKAALMKNIEFVHAACKYVRQVKVDDIGQDSFRVWLAENPSCYPNLVAFLASPSSDKTFAGI